MLRKTGAVLDYTCLGLWISLTIVGLLKREWSEAWLSFILVIYCVRILIETK